ncbi:hypothetical protein U1Q18_034751 [Sarracenia purpurea var. burkii]
MMVIHSLCRGTLLGVWVLLFLFASSFCHGEENIVLEVVGNGECADCGETNIKDSQAFSDLRVTIDCKNPQGEFKTRGAAPLDEGGKFTVSLPEEILEDNEKLKEECFAQLHNASAAPCDIQNGADSSKLILVSKTAGKHTFSTAGKLKFSATCVSAFWWKKPFPKFGFPFPPPEQPLSPPPAPVYKKPRPPPVPKYKKPLPPPPPVPVYKKPISPPPPPPVPVYKKPLSPPPPPPVPVYKKPLSPPPPPPVPVYKKPPSPPPPPPVPIYKKPVPPPVPIYKKPLPPPVPVYKRPVPPPLPIYEKPLPPPVPIYEPKPPAPY